MIHIDRSSVANPFEVYPKLQQQGRMEIAKYEEYLKYPQKMKQQRFEFKVYRSKEIRDALMELFHGKCAYCESAISATQMGDIEHYRPKTSVVESPDHPGYWWLVNTWENLFLTCSDCGRALTHEREISGKGNRFPLEDENARAFVPGKEALEKPLLLNPTVDFPEKELVFTDDGTVISDSKKGNTTIAVLGLNRSALVEQRLQTIKLVRQLMNDIEIFLKKFNTKPEDNELSKLFKDQFQELQRQTQASQEYAGLKRQIIQPFLERLSRVLYIEPSIPSWESIAPKTSKARLIRAKSLTKAYQTEMSDYTLKEEAGIQKYKLQRRLIERITIRNIRAIKELDLDLTTFVSERTPWLMLLGENGTGKSTILQAIALTLVDSNYFKELMAMSGMHPSDFIRYRCKSGSVSVKLSGFPKPHELVFYENKVTFRNPLGASTTINFSRDGKISVEGQSWESQTVLLGYGATRLLPRYETTERRKGMSARVDNLFNPFVPLFDAQVWLLSRKRKQFDEIAIVLKDLLSLDQDARLIKERQNIFVKSSNSKVLLTQLSDGYQSMVATTIDILEVALRLWPNLGDAEGIVLLDEIGSHLHPTWKMRVVNSLRNALPGMQFIATTHEPLCLRGLGAGEVIVMQRDEDKEIKAVTGLPSPSDFRVDQLLTSEFFGLNSTVDPDVEMLFDEYYALLALRKPTEEQTIRLKVLQDQLKDRRYLGNTLRENLMYEAIDQLIANQKTGQRRPITELKQEAVDAVSKIWKETVDPDKE